MKKFIAIMHREAQNPIVALLKFLIDTDKRLATSFLVVVAVAVLFFILGQVYDKEPHLRYEILSQSHVFDLRENISDLDVIFEGQSIRQQHQMLSLMTVRVENNGNATIFKQSSFDGSFLPGFRVANARIVKLDLASACNGYLSNAVNLERKSDNEFVLQPLIMDKGDSFVLKLLLLHSETNEPQLQAFGKIAGATPIEVTSIQETSTPKGFFATAIYGNLAIQATRIAIYTIGILVLLIVTLFIFSWLADSFKTWCRQRHIDRFKQGFKGALTDGDKYIFELYLYSGESEIVRINELLSDSELLRRAFIRYKFEKKQGRVVQCPSDDDTPQFFPHLYRLEIGMQEFQKLLNLGIVEEKGGSFSVNVSTLNTLRSFESFLLAIIPSKIIRARSQKQAEPYGTESNPVADPQSPKATNPT